MNHDMEALESLAQQVDPAQTLLHTYNWRQQGYDLDYPSYDQIRPEFPAFVKRARELGFHVQLHVNYFGVNDNSSLYPQFERWQVRDPFTHQKLWCEWGSATHQVKIAYINPAYKGWRDQFVERMHQLCQTLPIDALHLDQSFQIFNDDNGLIDGMSMIQGNIALHNELRAALPNVALSGEGLNEITYRQEALAQLQVWMMDPSILDWSPGLIALSHPISAYLFGNYTLPYLYAGSFPADFGQFYAAYQDAYEHWGVLPTFRNPTGEKVSGRPSGFLRHLLDETHFMQQERVVPDLDGKWPTNAAFIYRTHRGQSVTRTLDHKLLCGEREVSRMVKGLSVLEGPDNVPGWAGFNEKGMLALRTQAAYPVFRDPVDLNRLHLTSLPSGWALASYAVHPHAATFRFENENEWVANLAEQPPQSFELRDMRNQRVWSARGFMRYEDNPYGAVYMANTNKITCHPPFKRGLHGFSVATYNMKLPITGAPRFLAEVHVLSKESDGVGFTVRAIYGDQVLSATHTTRNLKPEPFHLDLTPLAGKSIVLEMAVDAGPSGQAKSDNAIWQAPRIVHDDHLKNAKAEFQGLKGWKYIVCGNMVVPVDPVAVSQAVTIPEGVRGVFLLREMPLLPTQPVKLLGKPRMITYVDERGMTEGQPTWGKVDVLRQSVADVSRDCLAVAPNCKSESLVEYLIKLPRARRIEFNLFLSARQGSSVDLLGSVEVNGTKVFQSHVNSAEWLPVKIDLSQWSEKPVLLSLITSIQCPHDGDRLLWAEPTLTWEGLI